MLSLDWLETSMNAVDREHSVIRLSCFGFLAILNLTVLWGGIQMRATNNYRGAHLAAVLALIPLAGCFLVLSIPAGWHALKILGMPEVRAAFSRAKES